MIGIIVARDLNGLIGYDGAIPWRKSADLKRFKKITTDTFIIMGRKTFDSIGKPLPNRTNVVITRNVSAFKDRALRDNTIWPAVFDSVEAAIKKSQLAMSMYPNPTDTDIWIIGGAEIYTEALRLGLVDVIDLTVVNQSTPVEDASKAVYCPELPVDMKLEFEELNPDDPDLTHLRYKCSSNRY